MRNAGGIEVYRVPRMARRPPHRRLATGPGGRGRGIGQALIPEPKGFSDPVKREAARSERAWEAATGLFASSAATATVGIAVGIAIPPVAAPVLLALAAGGFYTKLRSKWAKEDPPRPDYAQAVGRPTRSVTVAPLLAAETPASLARLLVAAVAAADRLGATIEAVEKSMGAAVAGLYGDEDAQRYALRRRRQAHDLATETGWALHGVAQLALEAAKEVEPWPAPIPDVLAAGPDRLLAWFDKGVIGCVVAAGLWPELQTLDAADPSVPEDAGDLASALSECAVSSYRFADALLSWPSGDDGPYPVGPGPGGSSGSGPGPDQPEPEPIPEATFAVAGA